MNSPIRFQKRNSSGKKETIDVLVVDDDKFSAYLRADYFSLFGKLRVECSGSIAEARRIVLEKRVKCILLDVMFDPPSGSRSLPLHEQHRRAGFNDGLVFFKWLKEKFPAIKVIGFSGRSDVASIFTENGAQFISKGAISIRKNCSRL